MSDVVHGRNVVGLFKIDTTWYNIFCATGCTFSFTNELIEKTDANAGVFRKYRVRRSDIAASFSGVTKTGQADGVISPFYFLTEAVRRNEGQYRVMFTDENGTEKIIGITGLIESLDMSGEVSSFSTSDMSIKGTGGFEIDPVDPPGPQVCDEFYSDWWTTTPGATSISGLSSVLGLSFAGLDVIEVDREGLQHDIIETGTPGNREAKYTGGSTIDFDPTNPFNSGERVFVIWLDNAS